MKFTCFLLFSVLVISCNNEVVVEKSLARQTSSSSTKSNKEQHWEGTFTNGMKQTYLSFDVSADGKLLKNLTFKGYWYCNGKLTQDVMGPEKNFTITNQSVNGVIVEPEGGGATATRYEVKAQFKGSRAEGTFRMNLNALGCDTRVLTWVASKK